MLPDDERIRVCMELDYTLKISQKDTIYSKAGYKQILKQLIRYDELFLVNILTIVLKLIHCAIMYKKDEDIPIP